MEFGTAQYVTFETNSDGIESVDPIKSNASFQKRGEFNVNIWTQKGYLSPFGLKFSDKLASKHQQKWKPSKQKMFYNGVMAKSQNTYMRLDAKILQSWCHFSEVYNSFMNFSERQSCLHSSPAIAFWHCLQLKL